MKTAKQTTGGAAGAPSAGYLRGEPGTGLYMPSIRPVLRDRADDVRAGWIAANSRAGGICPRRGVPPSGVLIC